MQRQVALVGTPNVGKSAIFNYLTGTYVSVSNYPGTTVEVSRGLGRINGATYEVVDTPGMYSLQPLTDEERVARDLLLTKKPEVVVHIADAKNIGRMLSMSLQLIEAGLPVILSLNLMDEAYGAGISINCKLLSELLGIPVVATTAVKRLGLEELKKTIATYTYSPGVTGRYNDCIEQAVEKISSKLSLSYTLSVRIIALLLLQGDETVQSMLSAEPESPAIKTIIEKTRQKFTDPLTYVIAAERQAMANNLANLVVRQGRARRGKWQDVIDRLTREPVSGMVIVGLVLYFGLYKFVGGFGAGVLVDYIDQVIFGKILTPAVNYAADRYLPWEWLKSILIGDFGLFTLGVRYAAAIILPIVTTFFLVFAILEDCGYLPRLAMLMDGAFRKLGLNGRAVIPLTLGLGCGTMAVFVTRTLESKRERLIATFLLSLAIPCSAQLGVVMALLSGDGTAVGVWAGFISIVFLLVGWLSALLLPGERSPFYMELPPLRMPGVGNVLTKVYSRMIWYFAEIVPVFIIASIVLWVGDRFGILAYIIKTIEPLMNAMGLPAQTAQAFLLGFFRRDYGAAGLYDLAGSGQLDNHQLLVASVALTLFVPCIAQLMVMIKERGIITAVTMVALIIAIAFASGVTVNLFLSVIE
jgi:ferrous iron transport protein B